MVFRPKSFEYNRVAQNIWYDDFYFSTHERRLIIISAYICSAGNIWLLNVNNVLSNCFAYGQSVTTCNTLAKIQSGTF